MLLNTPHKPEVGYDVNLEKILEELRERVREDMKAKGLSLNKYAEEFLEMPPSTLSRFLGGSRTGQGFETLFFIRDKLEFGYRRGHSERRLARFHRNLVRDMIALQAKHPSYLSLSRAIGLSKTAVNNLKNPKARIPHTTTVLKALRHLNKNIEQLIEE